MPGNNYTIGAAFETGEFKSGVQELSRLIKVAESEFKKTTASMDDWTQSEDGLNAKQKQLNTTVELQNKKIKQLKDQLANVTSEAEGYASKMEELSAKKKKLTKDIESATKQYGENSKEVKALKKELSETNTALSKASKNHNTARKSAQNLTLDINKEEEALIKNQRAIDETSTKLKDLDKKQEKVEDSTDGASSALADFGKGAAKGIAGIAAAVVGVGASMIAISESTRDYRKEMGKLATNAQQAGQSMDDVKGILKDVAVVTGDADAAFEGMNMLLATGMDTKQIESAAEALTGASIKFQGLKFEGLAEGLQETLATGVAVGPFAELIERTGTDLEAFNAGLAGCTTEAEKQNYVLGFLSSQGLAGVTEAYKEQNKDLIKSAEAQWELNEAMASLGAIAEPISASLKSAVAGLLTDIIPDIESIVDALYGIASGSEGSAEQLSSSVSNILTTLGSKIGEMIPPLLETITTLVPSIVETITQNLPMLVDSAVGIINTLISFITENLPMITESAATILTTLATAISENLPNLATSAVEIVTTLINSLLEQAPVLLEGAVQLFHGIVDAIPPTIEALLEALPDLIGNLLTFLGESRKTLLEEAGNLFVKIVEAIPPLITKLSETLPDIINEIVAKFKEWLPRTSEGAIELFSKVTEAIADLIPKLAKELPTIASTILGAIKDNGPELLTTAIEMFGNIAKAIPEMMFDLLKAVAGIGADIIEELGKVDLLEVGKNIIQGLIDGMLNIGGKIWEEVQGIGNSIVSGFKSFFGIHSPSKLMMTMGDYLTQGLAIGITDGTGKVITAVEAQAQGIENVYTVLDEEGNIIGAGISESVADGIIAGTIKSNPAVENTVANTYLTAYNKALNSLNNKENLSLWDRLMDGFDDGTGEMYSALNSMVTELGKGDILSSFTNFGKNIAGSIASGIGGWGGLAINAGVSLISGIFSNMEKAKQARLAEEERLRQENSELARTQQELARVKAELYTLQHSQVAEKTKTVGNTSEHGDNIKNVTINQNNYSPRALSQYEIYRQTRNATRLGLQGA